MHWNREEHRLHPILHLRSNRSLNPSPCLPRGPRLLFRRRGSHRPHHHRHPHRLRRYHQYLLEENRSKDLRQEDCRLARRPGHRFRHQDLRLDLLGHHHWALHLSRGPPLHLASPSHLLGFPNQGRYHRWDHHSVHWDWNRLSVARCGEVLIGTIEILVGCWFAVDIGRINIGRIIVPRGGSISAVVTGGIIGTWRLRTASARIATSRQRPLGPFLVIEILIILRILGLILIAFRTLFAVILAGLIPIIAIVVIRDTGIIGRR